MVHCGIRTSLRLDRGEARLALGLSFGSTGSEWLARGGSTTQLSYRHMISASKLGTRRRAPTKNFGSLQGSLETLRTLGDPHAGVSDETR